MKCPKCNKVTEHKHLRSCAHGIEETHMDGSERYQCVECGYSMFPEEGEKQGLSYVYDGKE